MKFWGDIIEGEIKGGNNVPQSKWKIKNIREQVSVIDGHTAPTILLTNTTYLHSIFKKWITANIWIKDDRIVYVGQDMPKNLEGTEIVDLTGKKVVPSYIEPHVHPFQLYNPVSFANFSAQTGTTTFISDNSQFMLLNNKKKSFEILENLSRLPFSFYWWARFDSQTEREDEGKIFSNKKVLEWLNHPDVLVGGELTAWPRLMRGDDLMLSWLQKANQLDKKVEGHLPGSSERTLARMYLLGVDSDHEAMTADEVELRLMHGYAVTLRYSSIRPDLPQILKDLVERGHDVFDHLMMTTDGSTPSFHQDGVMDKCIRAALEAGVPPVAAYQMAAYNVANYYNMTNLHGMIATGRLANINVLQDEFSPTPLSVLSKGVWLKRDGEKVRDLEGVSFDAFNKFTLDLTLSDDDFQFSSPIGIEMVNDVITKPYSVTASYAGDIEKGSEESYLVVINRQGEWRINTILKGFDTSIEGFASSYSNAGDIILIGKSIEAMKQAFNKLKEMNGGVVLVEQNEVIAQISLPVGGFISDIPMEQIIEQELALKQAVKERGYKHSDVIYTLLFLQSTHLPYIRITQVGLFDVLKNKVLLPSVMR